MDDLFKAKEPTAEITKNDDGSFVVNGKNYANVDALINKAIHADAHIATVIEEKRQLETKITDSDLTVSKVDALAAKIDLLTQANQSQAYFDNPSQEPRQTVAPAPAGNIDSDALRAIINDAVKPINDRLTAISQEKEQETFVAPLEEKYGETGVRDAVQEFQTKTGLDAETLKVMVLQNPKKMAKLITETIPVLSKPKARVVTDQVGTQNVTANLSGAQEAPPNSFLAEVKRLRDFAKGKSSELHTWLPVNQTALNDAYDREYEVA